MVPSVVIFTYRWEIGDHLCQTTKDIDINLTSSNLIVNIAEVFFIIICIGKH